MNTDAIEAICFTIIVLGFLGFIAFALWLDSDRAPRNQPTRTARGGMPPKRGDA